MLRPLLLLLALVVTPLSGCVVHAPTSTAGPAYHSSWIQQIKLKLEPATAGPRVAAVAPSSWHRVRVTVGRLDGTMPSATKTLDPFEDRLSDQVLGSLQPGPGYWVQVDLVHLAGAGTEWVVGSGRLGGGGQSVQLHAGPNAVPIAVRPMVAGGRLDAGPTPTATRRTRVRSGGVVIIDSSTIEEVHVPIPVEEAEAPWEEAPEEQPDDSLDWLFEDWESTEEDDWESAEDEDWESDDGEDDEDDDLGDTGDWLGTFSALRQAGR